MDPVIGVVLLSLLFGGTHLLLATRPVRGRLVARFGPYGFAVAYSLVAAATYAAVVHYYAAHRFDGSPGLALGATPARGVLIAGVVAGIVLMAATFDVYPRSPMAVFSSRDVGTPYGLERITRHPFFVGVALLAVSHMLLATRLVGTVLFAGLALVAIVGAWHQDRKLLARRGAAYRSYLDHTSHVPFAAILAGRQQLVWRELPVASPLVGLGLAFALRAVHADIFAHGGAWVIAATLGGAAVFTVAAWLRTRRSAAVRDVRPGVRVP
jgi:uncharacterized membrane protein